MNRALKIIRDGGLAFGLPLGSLGSPTLVELAGEAGFDAVFVDMEHGPYDLRDVAAMILAAERVGVTPIVRPPDGSAGLVGRLLDLGAQGLYFPHIDGPGDAEAAVAAVRYPPLGRRSRGPLSRATRYGSQAQTDEDVLIGLMLEDTAAIAAVEAISAVRGIDLIGIGPADLTASLEATGLAGDPLRSALHEAIQHVAELLGASKTGVRMSFPVGHRALPLGIDDLRALGVAYSNCSPVPEARLLASFRAQTSELNG